jgi:predicted secreted hydrolase
MLPISRYKARNEKIRTEVAVNDADSEYFMRRAKEEARLALKAEKPEVAAAHHGLSIEYSARARTAYYKDAADMPLRARKA